MLTAILGASAAALYLLGCRVQWTVTADFRGADPNGAGYIEAVESEAAVRANGVDPKKFIKVVRWILVIGWPILAAGAILIDIVTPHSTMEAVLKKNEEFRAKMGAAGSDGPTSSARDSNQSAT